MELSSYPKQGGHRGDAIPLSPNNEDKFFSLFLSETISKCFDNKLGEIEEQCVSAEGDPEYVKKLKLTLEYILTDKLIKTDFLKEYVEEFLEDFLEDILFEILKEIKPNLKEKIINKIK